MRLYYTNVIIYNITIERMEKKELIESFKKDFKEYNKRWFWKDEIIKPYRDFIKKEIQNWEYTYNMRCPYFEWNVILDKNSYLYRFNQSTNSFWDIYYNYWTNSWGYNDDKNTDDIDWLIRNRVWDIFYSLYIR